MQSIHTPTAMGQIELLNRDTDIVYGDGFRKMKEELLDKGYRFISESDCEILPALYQEYGTDMFSMLDAEYALVMYDVKKDCYIAARDPIGIRPLYYGITESGTYVFASEPKNLTSLVERILPFPPGHYFIDGKFTCYRDMSEVKEYCTDDVDAVTAKIHDLLIRGVEKRLYSYTSVPSLLSGGLSSTYQSACSVAAEAREKYSNAEFLPLDSLAATGGMGILAERAVRNQKKGMTLHENYEDLKTAVNHLQHWFLVDDIMYLRRGGRVGASAALIASALSIKPILQIDPAGKLPVIEKVRGTKAALRCLADHYKKTCMPGEDPVYICHADASGSADTLEEMIRAITPDVTIRKRMLSPIIGAHTGPRMVSVIHTGTQRS